MPRQKHLARKSIPPIHRFLSSSSQNPPPLPKQTETDPLPSEHQADHDVEIDSPTSDDESHGEEEEQGANIVEEDTHSTGADDVEAETHPDSINDVPPLPTDPAIAADEPILDTRRTQCRNLSKFSTKLYRQNIALLESSETSFDTTTERKRFCLICQKSICPTRYYLFSFDRLGEDIIDFNDLCGFFTDDNMLTDHYLYAYYDYPSEFDEFQVYKELSYNTKGYSA